MPIVFFALGAASVITLFFAWIGYKRRLFLTNSSPDYSAPGMIPRGNFVRFVDGFNSLFPNAPAHSYISLYAYSPSIYVVQETKFFIRSVGKRDGKHRFQGELRLSEKERHHVMNAIPMLERIGAPLEREDKSYGLLVLKTAKMESATALIDVANEFAKRVLECSDTDPLTISWHFAGYNSSKKGAKKR